MDSKPEFKNTLHETIWNKLNEKFSPSHLDVVTEKEGHWKTTVVSEDFKGLSLLDRHRAVQECLKDELTGPIHALTIVAKTSEDWAKMLAKNNK